MRVKDETMLDKIDEEIMQDEVNDEYKSYIAGQRTPKTCNKPKSHETMSFIEDLAQVIPNAPTFSRQSHIKKARSVIMLSFFPKVYHLVNKFGEQFLYQQ